MKPSKEQFLEAIAKIVRFSPAPRILGKAMILLRDPNSSIEDVATLIKTDTALTALIIRGANSAFYGGGERVSSLDQAVQKIGFRESIRLLNLSVTQIVSARGLCNYGITTEDFWAESLFNGLFVEALTRHTKAEDPDTAHTAGLLRFIGRLAINQSIQELGCGLFWDTTTPIETWELENVGFPQTHAGALLLRAWQFSDQLIQAIEWQNDPSRAPAPNGLAEALHFTSSVLPSGMGLSFTTSLANYTLPPFAETEFVRRHNLSLGVVTELLAVAKQNFDAISNKIGG